MFKKSFEFREIKICIKISSTLTKHEIESGKLDLEREKVFHLKNITLRCLFEDIF